VQLRKIIQPLVIACSLTVAATSHAACPFNVIDGNAATTDALRDGVLLVRYAQGLRGAALVAGMGAGVTAATVESNIAANTATLDVNGNGVFDLTDAAIIARNVFGFAQQSWMPDNLAGAYATRTTAALVKAFIDGGCSAPVFVTPTNNEPYDAARFLQQATFGPSRADIAAFLALGGSQSARANAWIDSQLLLARSGTHFSYLTARKAEYVAGGAPDYTFGNNITRESFWGQALTSPDQLRQRLALALSEVLVVSEYGGSNNPYELAAYLDLLADNAFGNYRDLLYKISLSPAMGRYLSHLRNDGGSTNPNENFAREILQLFGVGLFRLNQDGTRALSAGEPIPTYDEATVKGFARVFTGFAYDDLVCKGLAPPLPATCTDSTGGVHPNWYWEPERDDLGPNVPPDINGWRRQMVPFVGRHSKLSKQLLAYNYTSPVNAGTPVAACTSAVALASLPAPNGGLLAAPTPNPAIDEVTGIAVPNGTRTNRTQALAAVDAAIDNIFCHPNVGPFVSKHLIRFFVTSTPSDAYVARVTAKFNNNGSGIRGDMKAVIKAVLTDVEATPAGATVPANFGKLKEPMLRLSGIFRAFNTRSYSGRYRIDGLDSLEYGLNQGPLQSPTVFNYFHPEFAPPGPVATANAIAPEFEITTTTAIAATQNYFGNLVTRNDSGPNSSNAFTNQLMGFYGCSTTTVSSPDPSASSRQHCLFGNLDELFTLHADTSTMFDYINLVMLGGSLSPANKAKFVTALDTAYPTTAAPVLVTTPPNSATSTQLSTYNSALSTWQQRRRDRVKGALWLAVHSPEFQIQR
jgi:uncharacterized protein (DUF1800 family)